MCGAAARSLLVCFDPLSVGDSTQPRLQGYLYLIEVIWDLAWSHEVRHHSTMDGNTTRLPEMPHLLGGSVAKDPDMRS